MKETSGPFSEAWPMVLILTVLSAVAGGGAVILFGVSRYREEALIFAGFLAALAVVCALLSVQLCVGASHKELCNLLEYEDAQQKKPAV